MSLILDGTAGLFGNVTGGDISGNIIGLNGNSIPVTATGSTTARSLANRFADVVNVKDFGAVGNGATDDTAAIQAAINFIVTSGGGKIFIPRTNSFYAIRDTLTVGSNVRIEFDSLVKLTTDSSTGTVLYLAGDNIEIINPLIDGGGNLSSSGENGIGIVSGNNIQIRGGKIKNCYRGGTGMLFGGKGVQIESGGVEGVLVDGTQFSDCFMAMSTIRDGGNVNSDYGILFSNIKADNCDILLFVKQSNINNTNGLEHTIQLNNFYSINCGAFEGVMQFSRASNVQVSNGVIINNPGVATTPLIRGNHRFCRFDNIRFSGNCNSIIDLDPSTFAADSSYVCENNTYNINYSGTAGYVAYSTITTPNRILQDCIINASLDSDVTNKIVGDELRNGYCRLEIQQADKTIISTTATLFLEGRTNFASFPSGISMMRFNSSQIEFPSTQIASTNVNTLDDYEEGVWTPTDNSGASLSFASSSGDYIKIGKMVFASFSVTYPITASGANAVIASLPFTTSATGGRATCGLSIGYTDQGSFMSASANANETQFVLVSSNGTILTNANMSGKTLRAVFSYMANS